MAMQLMPQVAMWRRTLDGNATAAAAACVTCQKQETTNKLMMMKKCHLSKTIDNKQNDDDELVEVIQRVQLVVLFR